MPLRAIEAAKLYSEGYAPENLAYPFSEPGETLAEMGIPFVGEDYYDTRVLMHEGVPQEAIHVLATPIVNTAGRNQSRCGRSCTREGRSSDYCYDKTPYAARSRCSGQASLPATARPSCAPPWAIPSIPTTGWRTPAMLSMCCAKSWAC